MQNNKKVIVVGAGTTGYLAAAAIAKNCKNLQVNLVHSSKYSTIGVGEGLAWGAPHFMKNVLGLNNEREWMALCNAVYKFSITKINWTQHKDIGIKTGYPYTGSYKLLESSSLNNFSHLISHNDKYSLYDIWVDLYLKGYKKSGENLANLNEYYWSSVFDTVPADANGELYTFPALGHSYHIDTALFGETVHNLVGKPNKVSVIDGEITSIVRDDNGNIKKLILHNNKEITGDLFIDCSGFNRILANQLDLQFRECGWWTNNSALVSGIPHSSYNDIGSSTVLRGMKHGWSFSVPGVLKTGTGYVFNSNLVDDENLLMTDWGKVFGNTDLAFKKITWKPGYYNNAITGNCLLLGISHGFTEPYDSTSISSTMLFIQRLIKYLDKDTDLSLQWKDDYNFYVNSIIDDIKFTTEVAFHLAPRNDSEYWKEMKQASLECNTMEKLQDTILDDKRKKWLGHQNLMYSQETFINTALYYNLTVKWPPVTVTDTVEKLAINWFDFFSEKNRLQAKNAITTAEFYKKYMYPDLFFNSVNH